MLDFLKTFDPKKISTTLVLFIFLASTGLLFLPAELLQRLYLIDFKTEYGKWIGPACGFSAIYLILLLGKWGYKKVDDAGYHRKLKKEIKTSIDQLDAHEKSVLREFYLVGANTLKMPLADPTVAGLIRKRIIYQVGSIGEPHFMFNVTFNFSLTLTARKFINPTLVGYPVGKHSDQDIRNLLEHRPNWAKELYPSSQRY